MSTVKVKCAQLVRTTVRVKLRSKINVTRQTTCLLQPTAHSCERRRQGALLLACTLLQPTCVYCGERQRGSLTVMLVAAEGCIESRPDEVENAVRTPSMATSTRSSSWSVTSTTDSILSSSSTVSLSGPETAHSACVSEMHHTMISTCCPSIKVMSGSAGMELYCHHALSCDAW
jgi:hypothetical protein